MPDYPPMPDYPATPDYPRDYPAAAGYPGYPPPAAQGAPEPGYPGYPENSRYPGQPGAAGPGGQSPNGHQPTAPPAPVSGPVTAPGPAIAHDEYAPGHEGYGVVPDHGGAGHHGAGHHGLAPDEYGVVYDNYGLPGGPAEAVPEAHGLPEPGAAGPGPAAAAQYDGPAAQYDGPAGQYDGPAGQYDGPAARSGGSAARWAMLSYLTVPLFGFVVPLLVYLGSLRGSRWTRTHAAQALNVWITVFLYGLSALIMGTMLALDSPQIALIVFGPLVVALFAVMLTLLIRAAAAASKGEEYTIPRWLCSPIVR
jgi:uncharacterized Tic20 family protein